MKANFSHWLLTLLYGLLLTYGTLFPLEHIAWDTPVAIGQLFDWEAARRSLSMSDLMVNLLVYLPWGWLLFRCLGFLPVTLAFLLTVALGAGLSTTLEYIQLFIPARVSSFSDILINTLGTALGALGAITLHHLPLGRGLRQLRQTIFETDRLADLGILVLGVWALSELTPLVPSLDFGNLKHGIKPVWSVLTAPGSVQGRKVLIAALEFLALGILLRQSLRSRVGFWKLFWMILGGVMLLKVPVVGRQLSAEDCLGLVGAFIILGVLGQAVRSRTGALLGLVAMISARILDGLSIGDGASLTTYAFNWIPFAGQHNGLVGLIDILLGIWPYLALVFLVIRLTGSAHLLVMVAGAVAVFSLSFYLEWRQQQIPGRYPDATDAYLALAGWLFAWFRFGRGPISLSASSDESATQRRVKRKAVWVYGVATLAVLLGATRLASRYQTETITYDDQGRRLLPRPDQLSPVHLPGFRYRHPRLPAPAFSEIERIKRANGFYLTQKKRAAAGGRGDFNAIALAALIDPVSIDWSLVTARLTALKYTWRGHEQALPVALIYDWAHPYLSQSQRAALQSKLAEGCRYLSNYIRKEALSPYNVYLYNSPFQALMAVSLALYGDHPNGEQCMAFANDFWKNRVLPVWRQVMGRQGGWHEGGEYIGIGIGRAVYSVPAMWRSATGEDLLRSEPGIRGFLDFAVYRQRPDHTHMRWGDAKFFDKWEPERFALALEFKNRAAYSFFGCNRRLEPTAWPWGPLPDESLCDAAAVSRLPLQEHFDGLGMVIARSDWSDDSTYVTFKAGDNYWSHSHLDQGAFTLYKGGPLAIDSGLYGPKYGSDHHMNYTYQTIAHNVITVTDPEDRAELPGKDKQPPRPIANDGGQRRVGSGWGKRAPIDIDEWKNEIETYHTGRIARYYDRDDLVIAVAELTPAYTNDNCGRATVYDRTCRVERYWRIFFYDRREDVVVIYDDITATDSAFVKRSLIHTLEQPQVRLSSFTAEVPPKPDQYRRGGRLEVDVLFPVGAYLNPVGGKGAEFWVDGVNYDENGQVWANVRRHRKNPPEPGRWRVEVVPPQAQKRDRFLMVLKPSLLGSRNLVSVMPLREGETLGCRLAGLNRTVTLRFPGDLDGVIVESGEGRRVELTIPRR